MIQVKQLFFIMGISSREKKLDFVQTMLCFKCGQFGRFEVYMTYTYFSLFFIPLFKWGKRFFVKSSCCNTIYDIDNSIGYKILKGEHVVLNEQDLHASYSGTQYDSRGQNNSSHSCTNCGYPVEAGFQFCPKCGNKL